MKAIFFSALFLSCVPLANWLIGNWGTYCVPNGPCLIPVAPGMMAPSGVLVIGLALALRDILTELVSRKVIFLLLMAGSFLSLLVSPPSLAIASAVAFVISECLDWIVYEKFRKNSMPVAVFLSGALGAVTDTVIFSYLAFGEIKWAAGLLLAKIYASIVFAVYLKIIGWRPISGVDNPP